MTATDNTFRVPNVIAKDLAQALEEEIVFGELAPNTRLTEEEIVKRFNVSRSPVREALRILKQDGLIVMASRRGARVPPLSVADLDEIYMCRIALEALAAEQAVIHRMPEDAEEMTASLDRLRKALPDKNPRIFFEANVALTTAIHRATHNVTLMRLLANVGKQALRYRYLAYLHAPELMQRSVEYNVEIVDAILSNKRRHARSLTEDVLESSWKNVRQRIHALASNEQEAKSGG